MIETIQYNSIDYPALQAQGNAAKFAIPFALEVIKPQGKTGYDIGCNRTEWALPGAIPIDLTFDTPFDAYTLPEMKVYYIFSSHCLEHLRDWVEALDYWVSKLHDGGILFLYLPHYKQGYWRNWQNRKHIHNLSPEMLRDYLTDKGMKNIFVTEWDLNYSFYAIAEK